MSFCISKTLFNQRTFSILNKCCLLSSSKLLSKIAQENIGASVEISESFMSKDKQYCQNFINTQMTLPINWEILEKDLTEMKTPNIRSTVVRSCQMLNKGDLAIDYYQYLLNKGEELSLLDICLFIKLLGKHDTNLEKYDKLIRKLFDKTHCTIFALEITVKEAVNFFSKHDDCFKEILVKYNKNQLHMAGVEMLIIRLFDVNKASLAWEILNKHPDRFSPLVVESFFKFCIRLAEENKFSIAIINNFINFTKKHVIVTRSSKVYDLVAELIDVLNKSETGYYTWHAEKCEVTKTESCSSCFYKFKPDIVTSKELEELKQNFLEKVIICRNINMKSTPIELNNFLNYLDNSEAYDIVIDALNLYAGNVQKRENAWKVLSFFERKGMKMLLIGREHFKTTKLYRTYHKKAQIFLTRNDSLDDLFYLYAAMNEGLNTYFYTSDFLRDHAKFFDDFRLNALFHKWQISHQYLLGSENIPVTKPRRHSDMSQSMVVSNKNNMKQYSWHLSYLERYENYRINTPAKWICLKAKSKAMVSVNDSKEERTIQETDRSVTSPLR